MDMCVCVSVSIKKDRWINYRYKTVVALYCNTLMLVIVHYGKIRRGRSERRKRDDFIFLS